MKHLFLFALLISAISTSRAQQISNELIGSAGQTSTNNSIQLDWSVGEVVVAAGQNKEVHLNQGFHQPYRLKLVGPVEIIHANALLPLVYPNPTSNYLYISELAESKESYNLILTDGQGNKMNSVKAIEDGSRLMLNLENIAPGLYILQIYLNGQLLSNQKVLKAL